MKTEFGVYDLMPLNTISCDEEYDHTNNIYTVIARVIFWVAVMLVMIFI
jgi:hypothetical protein